MRPQVSLESKILHLSDIRNLVTIKKRIGIRMQTKNLRKMNSHCFRSGKAKTTLCSSRRNFIYSNLQNVLDGGQVEGRDIDGEVNLIKQTGSMKWDTLEETIHGQKEASHSKNETLLNTLSLVKPVRKSAAHPYMIGR